MPAHGWRRRGPLFHQRLLLVLMFLVGIALTVYATWLYDTTYPRFRQYSDQDGRYAIAFPAQPHLLGSEELKAERDNWFWRETYRVQITPASQAPRLSGTRKPDAASLTWRMHVRESFRVIHPRSDLPADAAVEYEKVNPETKLVTVGRVMLVGDVVYEMTVEGHSLSLTDWRVQRFFNSFLFPKR